MERRYLVFQFALSVFMLTTLIRAQNDTETNNTDLASTEPTSVTLVNMTSTTSTVTTTTTTPPASGGNVQPSAPEDTTSHPDLAVTSEESATGTDSNGTTGMPTKAALCYMCVGCTETNSTCLSPTGICYMSFSTLTNLTNRGCQVNETSCEIQYPGGISANGVCQYCCTGKLCNGDKLTLSQCLDVIGSLAAVGTPTSTYTVLGMLLVSLTAAPSLGHL